MLRVIRRSRVRSSLRTSGTMLGSSPETTRERYDSEYGPLTPDASPNASLSPLTCSRICIPSAKRENQETSRPRCTRARVHRM